MNALWSKNIRSGKSTLTSSNNSTHRNPLTARREIVRVSDKLNSLKPHKPQGNETEQYHPFNDNPIGEFFMDLGGNMIAFLIFPFSLAVTVLFANILILNSLFVQGIFGGTVLLIGMSVISVLGYADGNPTHKFRSFLSKIFFTKKQRKLLAESWLRQQQSELEYDLYVDSLQVYKLLVQQEIEKLKHRGIFEAQKKMALFDGRLIGLNEEGNVVTVNSKQYDKKYLATTQPALSNHQLADKIIKEIVAHTNERK